MKKAERGLFEKPAGSGIWWIRYTDADGRYRRESIGRSWKAASDLLAKRRTDAVVGKKMPELRSKGILFAEIADDAIAYVRGRYRRPADDVARLEVVKEWFKGRAAASLTSTEIESRLKAARLEKKWSASTYNHHLTVISLAYTLGERSKKISERPMLEKESERSSMRVRYLTPAEEEKLRFAIRSNRSWSHHEPELDLALHTGLRRGAMYLDLVWENVNLNDRTATIPRTKNDDPVTIPMNAEAMRALAVFRSRSDGTGRVVRNIAGETLSVTAHWFVGAVRQAGIQNFTWHDLRHTFASRLRQRGVPLGNIAELLGHKGLAMTQRYAHLAISNLHEAVSRLERSTTVAPESKEEKFSSVRIN